MAEIFNWNTNLVVVGLGLLSGITTVIGVGLAILLEKNKRAIAIGIAFSGGIMIAMSVLELIPEAVTHIGYRNASLATASGIIVFFLLNYLIPHLHLEREEQNPFGIVSLKSAYLVVFGLILHDLPEGFAMANSWLSQPSLGLMMAIAIALHNIPEELAMAVPLIAVKKKKMLFKAALISAMAEPVGAITGLVVVQAFVDLTYYLLPFTAGAMIFISLHELFPMVKKYRQPASFATGLALSVVVYLVLESLIHV